jgi:hypothetical protein
VLAGAIGCGGAQPDPAAQPDAPAAQGEAHGERRSALLGTVRYSTNTCWNGATGTQDIEYLQKAMRYGRTAAISNAFAQCMDGAVRNTYRQCNGDPGFGADVATQLDMVMTAARSSVDVNIACSGGNGNASAMPGSFGQLTPETMSFSAWLQAVSGTPIDAAGPWPWSQGAGIIWHEALHQQGYGHGANDQASAKTACGYGSWSDADWNFQVNTLPYIVGNCISTVLERSATRCGAPLESGAGLNLVADYDGSTCAVVRDPHDASVAWQQVGWPRDAARIAACTDGRLYAQNVDRSVWVSRADGADGTWSWVTTPGGAQQIFCAGDKLHAFNDDRTLWRNDGDDHHVRWTYVGRPGGAKQVTGTTVLALFLPAPALYALNDDQTLWRSPSGEDGTWTYVGRPGDADRIAAGGGLLEARPFALNFDRSLWLNSGDGCDAHWHYVDFPFAAAEITASSMFTLYALNADRTLWKGAVNDSAWLSSVAFGRPRRCDGVSLVP